MEYTAVMYTVKEGRWTHVMIVTGLTDAAVHRLFNICVLLEEFGRGKFGLTIYPTGCENILDQEL